MTEDLRLPADQKYVCILNYFALSDNDQELIFPLLDLSVIATIKILKFLNGKGHVSWFEIGRHFGREPERVEYHIRHISQFIDFTIDKYGCTLNQTLTA